MNSQTIHCEKHGADELAIACIHICRAIDSGENVGFFMSTEHDGPRPDAWCRQCEAWSIEHPNASTKDWMIAAEFKFICCKCWDEAKAILFDVR